MENTVKLHEVRINKDLDDSLLSLLASSILKVKNIEGPVKVNVITPSKSYYQYIEKTR